MAGLFYLISAVVLGLAGAVTWFWAPFGWSFLLLGPLFVIGVVDSLQTARAVRRNFPVIGNLRYVIS
jgi:hypothetical protein